MTARRVLLALVVLVAVANFAVLSKANVSRGADLSWIGPHEAHKCEKYVNWYDLPGWYPARVFNLPKCESPLPGGPTYYRGSLLLGMFAWVPVAAGVWAVWCGYCDLSSWRRARDGGRIDYVHGAG